MGKHNHNWVLVESYSSLKKSEPVEINTYVNVNRGLFGGATVHSGRDLWDIRQDIVDLIHSEQGPSFTSQTWACNCGETKTNHQKHPSLYEILTKEPRARKAEK